MFVWLTTPVHRPFPHCPFFLFQFCARCSDEFFFHAEHPFGSDVEHALSFVEWSPESSERASAQGGRETCNRGRTNPRATLTAWTPSCDQAFIRAHWQTAPTGNMQTLNFQRNSENLTAVKSYLSRQWFLKSEVDFKKYYSFRQTSVSVIVPGRPLSFCSVCSVFSVGLTELFVLSFSTCWTEHYQRIRPRQCHSLCSLH